MRIPGFIQRNFWLKALALVIAVAIYWKVSEDAKEERTVTRPVEVHLTQDLMMISKQEFSVRVKVRGNKRDIDEAAEGIVCSVDVGFNDRRDDGTYRVRLSSKNFRTPGGLSVTRILSNPELTLQLQRRITRELPVRLNLSDKLPWGFRVSESSCIPKTVMVSGPESEIAKLKEVQTEPIPLKDRESSFEYEVALRNPSDLGISQAQVKVNIVIERNVEAVKLDKVPVGLLHDARSGIVARIDGDTKPSASVDIVGTVSDITGFKPEHMLLYLDVSGISTAGEHVLPVKCHISREGIRVNGITPDRFKVTVSEMPIKK